jgi:transcriptional regulator with XRE-family HTH domain
MFPVVSNPAILRVKLSSSASLEEGFQKTFNKKRVSSGLTQHQFSKMAGVSFGTTCALEHGKADPTAQFKTWFNETMDRIIDGSIQINDVSPFPLEFKVTKAKKLSEGVGAQFKALRYSFGLTQAEIASAARCSIQNISRIESDFLLPSQDLVNWLKENGKLIKDKKSYFPTTKTVSGVKKVYI